MRATRTVAAAAAIVAVAGGALAYASSSATPTVKFSEKEFKITRTAPVITLVHGRTYTIAVHNAGKFHHDLLIDGHGLSDVGIHNKSPIAPGASRSFTVKFPRAGTYDIYCAIPGHKAKGMELHIVVK